MRELDAAVNKTGGPASIKAADKSATATSVLVAVQSAQVREALVAMLGALDDFWVVADVDNDQAALEAARAERPDLVLIEPDLSGCAGWWAIKQMQNEHLARVVVALGKSANSVLAELVGVQSYVQIGASPRDLLNALEAAVALRTAPAPDSGAQAELELLPDAHPVLDKPTLVDL